MTYLAVGVAAFVSVALRAFQSLNVVHFRWLRVMPTAFGIAVAEVLVVANVAAEGFGLVVVPFGLGGCLGCWAAMYLHLRLEEARGEEDAVQGR